MTDSQEDAVRSALRGKSANGRLSCKAAFEIAAALGVEQGIVGAAANELGIKIVSCQLGCF